MLQITQQNGFLLWIHTFCADIFYLCCASGEGADIVIVSESFRSMGQPFLHAILPCRLCWLKKLFFVLRTAVVYTLSREEGLAIKAWESCAFLHYLNVHFCSQKVKREIRWVVVNLGCFVPPPPTVRDVWQGLETRLVVIAVYGSRCY